MNRTLILLIAVVVLGLGAFFALREQPQGPASSMVGADRDFAVDTNTVYKIFLADRNGGTTTLERAEDGWIYNGEYPARPDAMDNLLQAIHTVQMKFKPTNAAVPYMVKNLSTEGIKVELYGKQNDLLKTYYIGGATNDERGTYIIMEGAEQPYVASLPNWEGNIRFRYNLSGDDWRDRTIFGSQVEEIASVSVEYPKQQNKSFRLQVDEIDYEVTPYYPLTPVINRPLKTGMVERFLNGFSNIQAVNYANRQTGRDSIEQLVPFVVIKLTEKDGDEYSLKLFPRYKEALMDPKTGVVTAPQEVESYFGLLGTNDFMTVQDGVIRKVLWSYEFFFD